jgi:hypothetical protein
MFAYKSFESELGVAVRLPHALTALPRSEQERLREGVKVTPEEIKRILGDAERRAAEEQAHGETARIIKAGRRTVPLGGALWSRRLSPRLAVGLAVVALLSVAGSAWFVLRDTATAFSLADTDAILQLEHGRVVGPSLTATIADPKWDAATADEHRRLAGELFDLEQPKGIRVLSLIDRAGQPRATVSDGPGGRIIVLP